MNKLLVITLLYMLKTPVKDADHIICMFDSTLIQNGLYAKYKHLNPYFYTYKDGDWLTPLSKRYKKDAWNEFKLWLRVVIFDIYKEENYDNAILKNFFMSHRY